MNICTEPTADKSLMEHNILNGWIFLNRYTHQYQIVWKEAADKIFLIGLNVSNIFFHQLGRSFKNLLGT